MENGPEQRTCGPEGAAERAGLEGSDSGRTGVDRKQKTRRKAPLRGDRWDVLYSIVLEGHEQTYQESLSHWEQLVEFVVSPQLYNSTYTPVVRKAISITVCFIRAASEP